MTENKEKKVEWQDDFHCFVCGKENPYGLKLDFTVDGDNLFTEWVAEKRFQGYADVLHGGMISLILDETMVNLPWKKLEKPVVSAELNIRLKSPAKIGELIRFTSWMDEPKKRIVMTYGKAETKDGRLIAESSARCVFIKDPNLYKDINK